jgi:hypothetical protein
MKTSSAKDKGRRLQKLIAAKISELIDLPHGKDQPIESRPMGQSGCDIRLDAEARKRFPFSIEAKNSETWSLNATIKQCQDNCAEDMNWLVVLSKNRFKPIVVLDLDLFFSILKDAMSGEWNEGRTSREKSQKGDKKKKTSQQHNDKQ